MTERAANDTSWLDEEPAGTEGFEWLEQLETAAAQATAPAARAPRPPKRKAKKAKKPRAVKTLIATAEADPGVKAAVKLPLETLRGSAMYQAVNGKKRIWACDGEYVFFRMPRGPDGHPAKDANGHLHAGIVRHQRFLANGEYTFVCNQDDVQICKVNEQSSLFRKGVYLGEMSEGGVRRAVVLAACMRDWPLYVDCLDELARKVKGKYHDAHAAIRWQEHLAYIDNLIMQRRGPSPDECGRGLQQVRRARGEGGGKLIVLPGR